MMELDESALICDLAETYQIYDYRSLPLRTVATLSAGLRDDSRIKLELVGLPVSLDTFILATISDNLTLFRAGFGKDKPKKPFLFTEAINGETEPKVKGFRTAAEFEAALKRIRGE